MKLMFDCDDTLYPLNEPFMRAMKDVLPEVTENLDRLYATYRKAGDEIFDQVQSHSITIDESGIYRVSKMAELFSIPLSRQQAVYFQQRYRFYQDSISIDPCLEQYLRSTNNTLSILTNGQNDHQRKKLQTLGIFSIVEHSRIFTSEELGCAKPDPQAFLKACQNMGEDPLDWYYIGDHYENDMVGAKQAGLHTIHLNRHHRTEGSCSDYVVYSADELVVLLKKLEEEDVDRNHL